MSSLYIQYNTYIVSATIMILFLVWLMIRVVLSGDKNKISYPLLIFMFCTTGFLLTNTLEIISQSEKMVLFWAKAQYPFIVFIPLIWLKFALIHTRSNSKIPLWLFIAFVLIPVVTLVFLYIPVLLPYMWQDVVFRREGRYLLHYMSHGLWFWIYALYTYALTLCGAFIITRVYLYSRKNYQKRSLLILIGVFVPIIFSLVYLLKPIPGLVKDFTPIGYALSSILFYFGVNRYGLFSLLPMARTILVEYIRDGIIVLNNNNQFIDINPAAMKILGVSEKIIGQDYHRVEKLPDDMKAMLESGNAGFMQIDNGNVRHYSLDCTSIVRGGVKAGRLVVMKDVTESRLLMKKIEDMAHTDELTGLFNRRYFYLLAKQYLSMCERHNRNLSLVMIDIDYFKRINDTYGHQTGDLALREFSKRVRSMLRQEDVFARLGGEEFAIMMFETTLESTILVCERIRASVAGMVIQNYTETDEFSFTISIGIASPVDDSYDFDDLMARSDEALYKAKALGRNKVCVWSVENEQS